VSATTVTVMSQPGLASGEVAGFAARRGALFAAIWLFFLIEPLRVGWVHRDSIEGVLGIVATLAFGTVYMLSWLMLRRGRAQLVVRPATQVSVAWFGMLVALGLAMVLTLGEIGTTAAVYVAVAAVMFFPLRVALALVLLDAALVVVLGETVSGWDSGVGLAFAVCASSVAIFGIQQMMLRNIALVAAHEENAELAVENERTRFARDLHDILGHSLTVITVKAELAQRLLDVDPGRARAELADLERLSRDALSDVRRAVEGYRDLTLPGELTRARTALAAAGLEAHLPHAIDEVPTELRELFAWTVREGVTNVIRHSGATRCSVRLGPTGVEVCDDGSGPVASGGGHGLDGLRERATAAGAVLVTRTREPRGFELSVLAR
jgi:two-component system sensor histidine kinase DesK